MSNALKSRKVIGIDELRRDLGPRQAAETANANPKVLPFPVRYSPDPGPRAA